MERKSLFIHTDPITEETKIYQGTPKEIEEFKERKLEEGKAIPIPVKRQGHRKSSRSTPRTH